MTSSRKPVYNVRRTAGGHRIMKGSGRKAVHVKAPFRSVFKRRDDAAIVAYWLNGGKA